MSKGEERLVVHFWMGVMPPCRLLFLSPEGGMEKMSGITGVLKIIFRV